MATCSGRLLSFHTDPYLKIPVFISGEAERMVMWIGGQCDGFFVLTYMPQLAEELPKAGWSLAQLMTSSAFVGRGSQTHCQDAEDLDDLVGLMLKEHGMKEIALFASSTGVQVALEFLENGANSEAVTRVALQGIVMDPDADLFQPDSAAKRISRAEELVAAGRGEELDEMRGHYDIPVTAARVSKGGFLSLMEAFWLPAHRQETVQLAKTLSPIRVPLLIMLALAPGYRLTREEEAGFEAVMKATASTSELSVDFFKDTSDERRRVLKADDSKHTAAIVHFLTSQDQKRIDRERADEAEMLEIERRQRSVLAKSALRLQ